MEETFYKQEERQKKLQKLNNSRQINQTQSELRKKRLIDLDARKTMSVLIQKQNDSHEVNVKKEVNQLRKAEQSVTLNAITKTRKVQ